jgi:hypothetical protein
MEVPVSLSRCRRVVSTISLSWRGRVVSVRRLPVHRSNRVAHGDPVVLGLACRRRPQNGYRSGGSRRCAKQEVGFDPEHGGDDAQ